MNEPALSERTFDAVAASVHDAREFISEVRGLPRSVNLDDVALVVSELTTNAVIHAHTPFVLKVEVAAGRVRVEVADGNRQHPKVSDGVLSAVGGRGLLIVARLASAWGVVTTPAGKIVFAEFRSGRVSELSTRGDSTINQSCSNPSPALDSERPQSSCLSDSSPNTAVTSPVDKG
ncbi:MAG: ATP-binding protein [Acidimicrobiia bacterium]